MTGCGARANSNERTKCSKRTRREEDILMANEIEAGLIEPIPAVHVIDGAVVEAAEAGGVEAVCLYAEMRQARAGRVEEFSRRNRLVAQVERRWLVVRPDEVYPYGPMEFSAPGPVGIKRVEDSRNELSFFLEICDEDLIRYMVRCYAHQPSLASYWSTDEDAGCAVMKRAFPFNRYRQLLRYLHYSPEGFPPPGSERLKVFKAREKEDRVLKVRTVMARVNENSCRARPVGQNLVVDEATVAFRGRHMLRRYNPAKPTKYGYCVRALAEPDGYILSDELCGARNDPETMSPDERVMHGIGDELLSPLDLKPARVLNRLTVPFQGCYRTVFCDSYYTDVQLADYLSARTLTWSGQCENVRQAYRRNGTTVLSSRGPGRDEGGHLCCLSENRIQVMFREGRQYDTTTADRSR
ncbi:Hypp4477 [Branchiostoma lanceolatum]|uniref:Hypp4477 protein n=1 Tax=Branchiostoma lanceolatum TaxID=7740 RepID=A0A8K0AA31_BRALA|nr:Hypp4477 [Branchiostoma lanceolatum]